jgi:hypothetical protein
LGHGPETAARGNPATIGPAISMTPDKFSERFKDRAAAGEFAGQLIELVGDIDGLLWDPPAVTLKTEEQPLVAGAITVCETVDGEPWAKFSYGQKVTIRGRVPAHPDSPTLIGCIVTSREKNPAVKISAEELSRQYQADAAGTMKRYRKKSLILDGEVVDKQATEKETILFLKGVGDARIPCGVPSLAKSLIEDVAKGKHVTLHGKFEYADDGKGMRLGFCLPICGKR